MNQRDDLRRRIRRDALLLGLLAVAVYVVYYLLEFGL